MARPLGFAGILLLVSGGLVGCPAAPPVSDPCEAAELGLVTGRSDVTVNGNRLEIGLVLVGPDPCLVHGWPDLRVMDGRGHIADVGDPTGGPGSDAVLVVLERQLPFHIEWGSWCAEPPVLPLTARFDFVDGAWTELGLPDDFGPATCTEPGRSILFIDPAFPTPGDR